MARSTRCSATSPPATAGVSPTTGNQSQGRPCAARRSSVAVATVGVASVSQAPLGVWNVMSLIVVVLILAYRKCAIMHKKPGL